MVQLELNVQGGKIVIPSYKYLLDLSDPEFKDKVVKTFNCYKWYLGKIIRKGPRGKIIVNWYEYDDILEDADYRQRSAINQYVNLVLLALNILTLTPEKAWSFSDEGMNPWWGLPDENRQSFLMGQAFFTRKEDIIAHADASKKGRSDWIIFQMKGVIKKEEII
ncbi:MAG: hypothetical protein PHD31_01585 [Candidatus Pacebacteria bacterium]|nr:hypothetical protein [Candidatus Paceibacterota bacterium]